MDQIRIRMARPSHAEAFAQIMTQPKVYYGTLQLSHTTPESWQKRLESNDPQHDYVLVAEVEGKVVGNLGLHRSRHPRTLHVASLGMSVHDAHQGQGIGRALMAAAIDAADRWLNILRIELEVYPDNERAIKLYESFGFVVEGRKRMAAFRDGQYVDTLVMGRIRP
ncbi:GNAT family N-acetyltransferase [Symbiobacterium thermophilum]|uniref:Putative acetyltransferase n=1 Tax=Symbiobacterium thermophilum (strain DSM 24528 / JCM 14929 / IAM 14863 / T) TaxID=292459 RepID=Q67LP1_SYMTH|nr:GNAT family N-acetyltransferase [Symbiobacterium thermophilum]BAD41405.1 putative acetyltransferase [Symbiobacterium thermophilum IAM 14863]